jgi:hypothetical protein
VENIRTVLFQDVHCFVLEYLQNCSITFWVKQAIIFVAYTQYIQFGIYDTVTGLRVGNFMILLIQSLRKPRYKINGQKLHLFLNANDYINRRF